MIAVGLLMAFQVSVNVDVNRQGASAGVGVRSPLLERIPVTEEHRRTAFKDPAARDAFVTDALALGPTALRPVVLALQRSLQKEMDQLEKSALTRLQHALDHDARPLRSRRDLAESA